MSLIIFILGIVVLFRGTFRLAGREVARPIGRVIGGLLMVPFAFDFIYAIALFPSVTTSVDDAQMTVDMDRFSAALEGVFEIQLLLLIAVLAISGYLIYNSPRSGAPNPLRPTAPIKPNPFTDPNAPRARTPWDVETPTASPQASDTPTEYPDPFDIPMPTNAPTEAERGIKPPVPRPTPPPVPPSRPHPLEGGQRPMASAPQTASQSPARSGGKTPTILTPKEAGDYLHISEAAIMALIDEGKLAAARGSGGYRIARMALDDYLADSKEE